VEVAVQQELPNVLKVTGRICTCTAKRFPDITMMRREVRRPKRVDHNECERAKLIVANKLSEPGTDIVIGHVRSA
jgi:hypothetical protein